MREDPALRETRECIFLRFSAKIPLGIGIAKVALDRVGSVNSFGEIRGLSPKQKTKNR